MSEFRKEIGNKKLDDVRVEFFDMGGELIKMEGLKIDYDIEDDLLYLLVDGEEEVLEGIKISKYEVKGEDYV